MKHLNRRIWAFGLALICAAGLNPGLARAQPPAIRTQPQSAQVTFGYTTSIIFTYTLSDSASSTQWLYNDVPIPGANNTSYQVANLQYSNSGAYSVVLSNSSGATISSNAILSVLPPYTFITLAGTAGGFGTNGGIGSAARFSGPRRVVMDSRGNLFATDLSSGTIRKITPGGVVSTLTPHDADGNAVNFSVPHGLAIDKSNNLFVSRLGGTIHKLAPDGLATIIAGLDGVSGTNDGAGSDARFKQPWGVAVDPAGNVFVSDFSTIREVTPVGTNWLVTTIAGTPGATGYSDGTNNHAMFNSPDGLAVDASGAIIVADEKNDRIRKVTPVGTNWVVTTIAGSGFASAGDGNGTKATFSGPSDIEPGPNGEFYVTDQHSEFTVRKLVSVGTNWSVRTLAGSLQGGFGTNDGTGLAVGFNAPHGVVVDKSGTLFVVERGNNTVRKGWPADAVPATLLNPPVVSSGQVQMDFVVTTGSPTNFTLLDSDQLSGGWQTNQNAVLTTNVPGVSYGITVPAGPGPSHFYRLQQQ